jgi:Ecdysteroid kinase-like family
MTTEPLPRAADAEHLTEVLRRAGALGEGRVREVAVESSRATLLSSIVRLRPTYEGSAAGAPGSLILKTGLPGTGVGPESGRREVEFYTKVATAIATPAVPRCFEAAWDADTKDWHLLLEDLTDTHAVATRWPLPPTIAQCERIMRALAGCHAAWWDDARLGVSVGTFTDEAAAKQYVERCANQFTIFADLLGDRLSPDKHDLYERFLAAAPRLLARYLSHRDLTVVHGDAHVWNCFLAKDGEDDRFFDWDAWRISTATSDLAYMMAMHWYPERRRRAERPLLDHYHAALVAQGVRGYDRAALADDYRLSALWQLMTPVWQASMDLPPVIWWSHIERITLAVDDLGARDLLA